MNIVDSVNEGFDWRILDMKNRIETMHRTENTRRGLKAKASAGAAGFALFGDNVGKIIQPR